MCGFAGFIDLKGQLERPEESLQQMICVLSHRGPDDEGVWFDDTAGVGLGHRRLSIVDLSPEGHQPMISACGRYVIAYNGEIYNYLAIRKELEQEANNHLIAWRGHSDTEVALAAISRWGLEGALDRFNGMFAFALWDRRERVLHLARDRLGEKPLYYGWAGDMLLFGSELKALRANKEFSGEIDRNVLNLFFRYSYVPSPYSIYQGIYKLPAGSLISVPIDTSKEQYNFSPFSDSQQAGQLSPVNYWSVGNAAENVMNLRFKSTTYDVVDELEQLMLDAVRLRMEADVPLGAFLSGGIDSSTIVALMQAQSHRPVRTFSIGSYNQAYDEAVTAKAVAKHLGTDHTELYVSPEEAQQVIPRLPQLYDEPFADASQIPTFLVSQMARQHVTVSLSGDGGDELFAGYNRHFWARNIWNGMSKIPQPLRTGSSRAIRAITPETWDRMFFRMGALLPKKFREGQPGNKLHKLAGALDSTSPEDMYLRLVSNWPDPESLVIGGSEPRTVVTDSKLWPDLSDFTERMMYLDLVSYLPDDILVKVDRASMGVSLESRVPFLDHRLVEFSWKVPLSMKIKNGKGKWILRQLLYKYVPKKLVEGPKRGFGLPIDDWLRGPLRDWVESLLDETRLRHEGYLNPVLVRHEWHQHLTGKRNLHQKLWGVLMFQAWLNEANKSDASKFS